MDFLRTIAWFLFCVTIAYPADPLPTEIVLRTNPQQGWIKPSETMTIQAIVYGDITDDKGHSKKVRLRKNVSKFTLRESGTGWLSKPFRYQSKDEENFYRHEGGGLGEVMFGRLARNFSEVVFGRSRGDVLLRDSVLYTAPFEPGSYTVDVSISGLKQSITITVDWAAPATRPKEMRTFPRESASVDSYRDLVEQYAPFVAQETWFQPKSDFLARFDFDGDWRGDNNWETAEVGSSQAYVYYAVMETETHWFLIYNFFHPRDYSDRCVERIAFRRGFGIAPGSCHENDNEGVILTVKKDGSKYGKLEIMETLAHNSVYSYRTNRNIKNNVHSIDGGIEMYKDTHPVVFIESGGHGIYGSTDNHSRYSLSDDSFSAGTGVTYVYKGNAERPRYGNDREVGYELLPIYEHWWLRAQINNGSSSQSFDKYYVYRPRGGRPGTNYDKIPGSFLGRKFASNRAKPFWGWFDYKTRKMKILAVGQWALDPAYSVSKNLKIPGEFSLDYVFNPYLDIGKSLKGKSIPSMRDVKSPKIVNLSPKVTQGETTTRSGLSISKKSPEKKVGLSLQ